MTTKKLIHLDKKIKVLSIDLDNETHLCDIVSTYENGTKQSLLKNLKYTDAVRHYVKIYFELQKVKGEI